MTNLTVIRSLAEWVEVFFGGTTRYRECTLKRWMYFTGLHDPLTYQRWQRVMEHVIDMIGDFYRTQLQASDNSIRVREKETRVSINNQLLPRVLYNTAVMPSFGRNVHSTVLSLIIIDLFLKVKLMHECTGVLPQFPQTQSQYLYITWKIKETAPLHAGGLLLAPGTLP